MTLDELKEKLSPSLMRSIVNISKDPTLGATKIDQLQGLIFLTITGKYWDDVKNGSEEI